MLIHKFNNAVLKFKPKKINIILITFRIFTFFC